MEKPDYLTPEAQEIWDKLHDDFELKAHHEVILATALQAWDRLAEARDIIRKEGVVVIAQNGYAQKNAMLQVEKEARAGFLAAWKALGLDIEPPKGLGRPANDTDLKWDKALGDTK